MHPLHHAKSSFKKFPEIPYEVHLEIHNWMDASKAHVGNWRHRFVRHHDLGWYLWNQSHQMAMCYHIAKLHIEEDLGFVPKASDWVGSIQPEEWMLKDFLDYQSLLHYKYGGKKKEYEDIVKFFVHPTRLISKDPHPLARAFRFHSMGIFEAEKVFGIEYEISNKKIPTRFLGEKIVQETFGFIPSVAQWANSLQIQPWMLTSKKPLKEKQ